MTVKKGKIITCVTCGKVRSHAGKGECYRCYRRQARSSRTVIRNGVELLQEQYSIEADRNERESRIAGLMERVELGLPLGEARGS